MTATLNPATTAKVFTIWAHDTDGRILSLATTDHANSVEHLTAATAGDALAITRSVKVAQRLDYDTEEYEIVAIDHFRLAHPHGGIETVPAIDETPATDESDAFAVEHEEVINGHWEGFVMRGLTKAAAEECARIKSQLGSRSVRVVRDPQNDGHATNGQWI